MRIAIVTTWPTDVISGSGTAVFFNALLGGLHAHGFDTDVIAPNFDTSDYVQVTLQRFLYNADLRTEPRILSSDLVIGFDYDGYALDPATRPPMLDRKSTRLNSSHSQISYAVFCLKKKKN